MKEVEQKLVGVLVFTWICSLLWGCGSGDGSPNTPRRITPDTVALNAQFEPVKTIRFSWDNDKVSDFYLLFESLDGSDSFTEVAEIPSSENQYLHVVPLFARVGAKYRLRNCVDQLCSDFSNTITVDEADLIKSVGFIKGSNTKEKDSFGTDASISTAGTVLAISAHRESTSLPFSGAVYIFNLLTEGWSETQIIKPSDLAARDYFGLSTALSGDGKVLAVGARGDDKATPGVFPDGARPVADPDDATDSGAVYIFRETNGQWIEEALIKSDSPTQAESFGEFVWLSEDGTTLAISAPQDDFSSAGVQTSPDLNSSAGQDSNYGAVYIYTRTINGWQKQAYIKPTNAQEYGYFGSSLELDATGNHLVVGGGIVLYDTADEFASLRRTGRLYAFSRDENGIWTESGLFQENNLRPFRVAIDQQASKIAAYSWSGWQQGEIYIYQRNGSNWELDTSFPADFNSFDEVGLYGSEIQFSGNGQCLVVGDIEVSGCGKGINPAAEEGCDGSGAVLVYNLGGENWELGALLKKSTEGETSDGLGRRVAVDGSCNTVVVPAINDSTVSTGINGAVLQGEFTESGATYLF